MEGIRLVSGPIKYLKDPRNGQYEGKFRSRHSFLTVAPVRATACFPGLAFLILWGEKSALQWLESKRKKGGFALLNRAAELDC